MAKIKNTKTTKNTKKNYFFEEEFYEEDCYFKEEDYFGELYYREMIDKIDHPCYDGMTTEEFLDDPESIFI